MPSQSEIEIDFINEQLDILCQMIEWTLPDDAPPSLTDIYDDIAVKYVEARKIPNDKAADKKAQERAEKVCASIAKGLPDLAKGALSAARAFKNGDVTNGCASVIDMCAAAARMLGAILAASPMLSVLGPVGMLAGAIFSIIGQLLAFFGPKQESLIDQIEKLLLDLQSEEQLQHIKTVHDDINNFSKSLKFGAKRLTERKKDSLGTLLPSIMQMPLRTSADLNSLVTGLETFLIEMRDFQPVGGTTIIQF